MTLHLAKLSARLPASLIKREHISSPKSSQPLSSLNSLGTHLVAAAARA
jgi:hypothetical protein